MDDIQEKRYYLVPVDGIKERIRELKNSQSYMRNHNTGSGHHRGEVDKEIEMLESLQKNKTVSM